MIAKRSSICCFLLLAVAQQSPAQTPLSSEFTYQGLLAASGLPAITSADFQLSLFGAVSGGAQIGATIPKNNVAVVNGVFTLSLDFGSAAFSGNARWLQVAVRSPAGAGAFTTLAPRQLITATPNATFSSNTRGIMVDNSGRVGVGMTPSPQISSQLEVAGHVGVINGANFFSLTSDGTAVAAGISSDPGNNLRFFAGQGFGTMRLDADGSVGIGVDEPVGQLHVRAFGLFSFPHQPQLVLEGTQTATVQFFPKGLDEQQTSGEIGFSDPDDPTLYIHNADPAARIAFTGAEGTRFPSSGKEDLRIIRGRVDPDGSVIAGNGYSVNRLVEGIYRIDFDTPFGGEPVATANSISVGFSSTFVEFTGVANNFVVLQVVRRSDGNLVDGRFYFIAMGPRS